MVFEIVCKYLMLIGNREASPAAAQVSRFPPGDQASGIKKGRINRPSARSPKGNYLVLCTNSYDLIQQIDKVINTTSLSSVYFIML